MFNGIIEDRGKVEKIVPRRKNLTLVISSKIAPELKEDQSLSHNGVCLTVEKVFDNSYQVTAVNETLQKSNLGKLSQGDLVNLERSLSLQNRIDGHIVQGHVDTKAVCRDISEEKGSWSFTFSCPGKNKGLIVEKGSIAVDGISLTAFNVTGDQFSVAIIPYTYYHTNFEFLEKGTEVNLEFDILGKYILQWIQGYSGMIKGQEFT